MQQGLYSGFPVSRFARLITFRNQQKLHTLDVKKILLFFKSISSRISISHRENNILSNLSKFCIFHARPYMYKRFLFSLFYSLRLYLISLKFRPSNFLRHEVKISLNYFAYLERERDSEVYTRLSSLCTRYTGGRFNTHVKCGKFPRKN